MAKTNVYQHFCPVARSLEVIGEKWSLLIVRDLLRGPQRFTDLLRGLGNITPKWLTMRLRELEAAGLLARHQEVGKREVWYELTPMGRELGPVIGALNVWGMRNALRPLMPGEALSASRMMESLRGYLVTARVRPSRPMSVQIVFDSGALMTFRFDGRHWFNDPTIPSADVVVRTTEAAWADLLVTKPANPESFVTATGEPWALNEWRGILGALLRGGASAVVAHA